MPVKKAFYAVSGMMLKYYEVTGVELEGGRARVVSMKYVDALKSEDTSALRIYDITPVASVPDQFFTKEYLESGRLYPYQFRGSRAWRAHSVPQYIWPRSQQRQTIACPRHLGHTNRRPDSGSLCPSSQTRRRRTPPLAGYSSCIRARHGVGHGVDAELAG